jgi:hypothetical protein
MARSTTCRLWARRFLKSSAPRSLSLRVDSPLGDQEAHAGSQDRIIVELQHVPRKSDQVTDDLAGVRQGVEMEGLVERLAHRLDRRGPAAIEGGARHAGPLADLLEGQAGKAVRSQGLERGRASCAVPPRDRADGRGRAAERLQESGRWVWNGWAMKLPVSMAVRPYGIHAGSAKVRSGLGLASLPHCHGYSVASPERSPSAGPRKLQHSQRDARKKRVENNNNL